MAVIHVLKDGTRVDDITGHVVKVKDASQLYRLMRDLNSRPSKKKERIIKR